MKQMVIITGTSETGSGFLAHVASALRAENREIGEEVAVFNPVSSLGEAATACGNLRSHIIAVLVCSRDFTFLPSQIGITNKTPCYAIHISRLP